MNNLQKINVTLIIFRKDGAKQKNQPFEKPP